MLSASDHSATAVAVGHLFVLETAGNTVVARVRMDDPSDDAMGVAVAPDGSHVYLMRRDGILVLDTATDKIVADIPARVGRSFFADFAITPDGRRAFLTGFPGFVDVVDLASETTMPSVELTPLLNPTGITASPDGKHVYVASDEGVVPSLTSAPAQLRALSSSETRVISKEESP